MITCLQVLSATLLFAAAAHCYSSFLSSNPNGNSIGGGLGHISSSGSGARNAYGNAFAAAGSQWTRNLCFAGSCSSAFLRMIYYPAPHVTLCPADSDGDGQSNGFELGDPCCIWTSGDAFITNCSNKAFVADADCLFNGFAALCLSLLYNNRIAIMPTLCRCSAAVLLGHFKPWPLLIPNIASVRFRLR